MIGNHIERLRDYQSNDDERIMNNDDTIITLSLFTCHQHFDEKKIYTLQIYIHTFQKERNKIYVLERERNNLELTTHSKEMDPMEGPRPPLP